MTRKKLSETSIMSRTQTITKCSLSFSNTTNLKIKRTSESNDIGTAFSKANCRESSVTVLACLSIEVAGFTRVNGPTNIATAAASSNLQMAASISACLKTIKQMAKAFLRGEMAKYTTVNFWMAKSKASESGKESSATRISGNGPTIRSRGMGFTSGKTVIDTRESGSTHWSTGKGLIYSITEMSTRAHMLMVNHAGSASTSGPTVPSTLAISLTG